MAATPVTNSIILQIQSCSGNPSLYVSQYGTPAYISTPDGTVTNFLYNGDVIYPQGYEGELVSTSNPNNVDDDDDGLTWNQEKLEGTLDTNKDTDEDGLSDYIESQWYPNRQSVFCGTNCAYPNPTQKDIYVEIDWMKDSSNQIYKPTSAQLSLVEDMYADKGINFHADVGQFGGGNELASYTHSLNREVTTGQIDFWDYKNGGDGITANFSPARNAIWHYMIYGYEYSDPDFTGTSSGWAEVMGDDIFVSGGWIEDRPGLASVDRAIANTLAHETGHTLCLSDVQIFAEQPAECIYDGVDNDNVNDAEYNLENYMSVMNYRYQLTDQDDMNIVDYSDGSHGIGDHNDWNGVLLGMGRFTGMRTLLGAKTDSSYYITPDGDVIIDEAPVYDTSREGEQAVVSRISTDDDDKMLIENGGSSLKLEQDGMDEVPLGVDKSSDFDWLSLGGIASFLFILGLAWRIRQSR